MRLTMCSVFLCGLCVLLGCQGSPPVTVSPTESALPAPAAVEVWAEVPKQCA
jgi:hypothetical protein